MVVMKNDSGSRSEYFINLVNHAAFLSESVAETKLIEMLASYFDSDIHRAIIMLGLKTFEKVDEYLRKIDAAETVSKASQAKESNNVISSWKNTTNNIRRDDRGQITDQNIRNINTNSLNLITKFNEDLESIVPNQSVSWKSYVQIAYRF